MLRHFGMQLQQHPAFQRMRISLLAAFEGWPRVTPPAATATKGKRMFQLRTYENPSNGEHVRKVEMFPGGEYQVFKDMGFHPVFFGDMLMGSRMPNMTYMLSFTDSAELEAKWAALMSSPEMEGAFHQPAVWVRSDRGYHHQPDAEPVGLLANSKAHTNISLP